MTNENQEYQFQEREQAKSSHISIDPSGQVMMTLSDTVFREDESTEREILKRQQLGLPLDANVSLQVDMSNFGEKSPKRGRRQAKPQFTVWGKQVYVNTDCVRLMPHVKYVQMLLDSQHKQLALRPLNAWKLGCLEWGRTVDDKRYPSPRSAELLGWKICELIGCKMEYRYQFPGELARALDEFLIVFQLDNPTAYSGTKQIEDGSERLAVHGSAYDIDARLQTETGGNGKLKTYQGYVYITTDGQTIKQSTEPVKQASADGD